MLDNIFIEKFENCIDNKKGPISGEKKFSRIGRIITIRMSVLFKMFSTVNAIEIKITTGVFKELHNLFFKK